MGVPRFAALVLLAVLTLAGAANAALLRYASQIDPGTMDPHALASVYNNRVLSQIYEPLIGRDEQFKLEPRLALSWAPLEGGKGWRFKLRPNVRFQDGTPFSADDVVFNVKRVLDPLSAYKTTLPNVTSARKVDELTVDLLTSQPTAVLPLEFFNFRIMSKAWCEKHHVERPQDYRGKEETYAARNANGTGPYRLVSWETDVKTVLAANPAYWGKRGNVTEARYFVVGSAATRVAGLISGEIDIVIDPAVQDVVRLRSQPGIAIGETISLGANFLGFNYSKPLFKDVRVRQAIRAAIDVEALRSKVMRDTATVGSALYTSVVDGFDARFNKAAAYDPAKAKALLREAGHPDGFATELDCSSQQPTDSLCQAIAGMLARVGIRVSYRPLSFNQLLPKLLAGDMSLYVIGWTPGTSEPEGVLVPLAHTRSSAGVGEYNFGGYVNKSVDALIDKGRLEFDPVKRAALFTEAMSAIEADAGFIPLIYRKVTWATRKNVKVLPRPNDILDLRFVNVE